MNLQTSLFPIYLNELQAETAYKKRKKVEQLKQVDFLNDFKEDWIERFADVENILEYLEKHPTTINVFRLKKLINPESLLKSQRAWISLYSKYTGMEKDFFKPYWVPIFSDSLDYFIDVSNKNLPVIESYFYFIEPLQYMKIVLLEKGTDLMKHNSSKNSAFSISFNEMFRQQAIIAEKKRNEEVLALSHKRKVKKSPAGRPVNRKKRKKEN